MECKENRKLKFIKHIKNIYNAVCLTNRIVIMFRNSRKDEMPKFIRKPIRDLPEKDNDWKNLGW